MAGRIVAVFGGTGFLGRRVVRHLADQGLSARIASRHPERAKELGLQSIRADIEDEDAVETAIAEAYGVVNAVSLYLERGTETFQALHVRAAERLARQAKRAGVERLVHVSGIGADATSRSPYIRSRGQGELAVKAAFANAIIIRRAVMFAEDDAFLNTIVKLLKRLPAYPLVWGRPDTAPTRLRGGPDSVNHRPGRNMKANADQARDGEHDADLGCGPASGCDQKHTDKRSQAALHIGQKKVYGVQPVIEAP